MVGAAVVVSLALVPVLASFTGVLGACVVGACVVGACVVGACVVGACVVGACVVGACVVGACVVGACVVGASVVGAAVVGVSVVGAAVVGFASALKVTEACATVVASSHRPLEQICSKQDHVSEPEQTLVHLPSMVIWFTSLSFSLFLCVSVCPSVPRSIFIVRLLQTFCYMFPSCLLLLYIFSVFFHVYFHSSRLAEQMNVQARRDVNKLCA